MANQERDPRPYELMTVFVPDISEEDTQAQVEKVSSYISNAGGTVNEALTDSPWGRRRLAYTVRYNGTDYRDGFYTVYHFDSRPSDLTELERDLKLDVSVMRYLLVHDDPKAGEKPTEGEVEGEEAAEATTPAEQVTAPTATAAPAELAAAPTATAAPAEQAEQTEAPAEETGAPERSADATEQATGGEAAETEAGTETAAPEIEDETSEKE